MEEKIYIDDGYIVIEKGNVYYDINLFYLNTKEKLNDWVNHLSKKLWFTKEMAACFTELVLNQFKDTNIN